MKIGIMSFYTTQDNYGQLLQCFAVQQLLKSLGHEPYHIRYTTSSKSIRKVIYTFWEVLKSGQFNSFLKLYLERKKTKKMWSSIGEEDKSNKRDFDLFREEYLSFTDKSYDFDKLLKEPPIFEAYVCGSDQIWSAPSIPYMLYFGPDTAKRLSIAASMGGKQITNEYQKRLYIKYLSRFDYISVRESNGANALQCIGISPVDTIMDPTLLMPKETFQGISSVPCERDYVFVYLLGNEIDLKVEEIFKWCRGRDYEVVYVTAQGRIDDFKKVLPTINEWLGYIENAKYVITNSFHGMALSIVLEKQFLALPLISEFARMNDRLTEVLDIFNLKSRLFTGSLDVISNPIDYKTVTLDRLAKSKLFSSKIKKILSYDT